MQCYKSLIVSHFLCLDKLEEKAHISFNGETGQIECTGPWSVDTISSLFKQKKLLPKNLSNHLVIDTRQITRIDSAGALLLHELIQALSKDVVIQSVLAKDSTKKLLSLVAKTLHTKQVIKPKVHTIEALLAFFGKQTLTKMEQCTGFLALVGELFIRFVSGFFRRTHLSLASIFRVIDTAGIQALPIIALLSFLVGVVLAYQMGLQLEDYGANIYIVFLTGMANLREFAPLISAIIVAGRSSSSFTAELGSMKINEEIDALKTMGLPPMELLILPKVIGMFIAFPLLVFWADIFATLGSMIMSKFMLHIPYLDYIHRFRESLGVKQLFLGLSKAPVFALVIALVGCFQGLQVKGSADSIGLLTTKAVVQAIFLIIIMDAAFSVIFSWLEL